MFAERFTLAQARRLQQLRTTNGKPFSRRHITSLLFVTPSQAQRLTALARQKNWSATRLEIEVKRLRPKRKLGGRRPRQPESRTAVVVQLIDSSGAGYTAIAPMSIIRS